MQFVRTLLWLVALIVFVILTVLNWETTLAMRIWPGYVWDTRLPAIIVAAFLLGLVPTWLVHRGTKWRLNRRISHLETAARNAAGAQRPLEPAPAQTPPPGEPAL
jgi:lipopolysaccharide assembly protein A